MKNNILQSAINLIDDDLIIDADKEEISHTIHFAKWIAIIVAINVLLSASIVTVFAVLGKSDTSPTILSDEETLLNKIREANKYSNIFEKVTSFTAVDDKVLLGERGEYFYAEKDTLFRDSCSSIYVESENIQLSGKVDDLRMNPISNHTIDWYYLFDDLYEGPYTDVFEISTCDYDKGYMEIYSYHKTMDSSPVTTKLKISILFDVESLLIKKYKLTLYFNGEATSVYSYNLFYNMEPNEAAQKSISLIRDYVNLYKKGDVCNVNFINVYGDSSMNLAFVKGAKTAAIVNDDTYWPSFIVTEDCTIEGEEYEHWRENIKSHVPTKSGNDDEEAMRAGFEDAYGFICGSLDTN